MAIRRESIVCPGCGCLCDDLDVTLEGDRLVEVDNVCLWGVNRFLHTKKFHPKKDRGRLACPQVRRRGRLEAVSYETALEEAAEVLGRARRPVVYGLTNSGSWAQEAALRLARSLGARLEPGDLAFQAPFYQSLPGTRVLLGPPGSDPGRSGHGGVLGGQSPALLPPAPGALRGLRPGPVHRTGGGRPAGGRGGHLPHRDGESLPPVPPGGPGGGSGANRRSDRGPDGRAGGRDAG